MSSCPFEGNPIKPCPIPVDYPWYSLREKCELDNYGRNCAAIVCQELVAASVTDVVERQSAYDRLLGEIDGQFRLTTTPEGEAPEQIRESISSTTFPLRQLRPVSEGKVWVSHLDLYLTLLNSEKLEEANWYDDHLPEGETVDIPWWVFEAAEGVHDKFKQPRGSWQTYDKSFSLNSAALANSHIPPLVRIRTNELAPKSIPISEFLGSRQSEDLAVDLKLRTKMYQRVASLLKRSRKQSLPSQ